MTADDRQPITWEEAAEFTVACPRARGRWFRELPERCANAVKDGSDCYCGPVFSGVFP